MSIKDLILPSSPDGAKHEGFAKIATYGGALVLCGLLSSFLWAAFTGAVALGLTIGGAWLVSKLSPYIGLWGSNLALKAIRWEAWRNPIPSLWTIYKRRAASLEEVKQANLEMNKQVNSYAITVENFIKTDGAEASIKFIQHLTAMKTLLERRYAAVARAEDELRKNKKEIERASRIWDMTQASKKMEGQMRVLTRGEANDQIINDTALQAIQQSVADSFAALDHEMRVSADLPELAGATDFMKSTPASGSVQPPVLPKPPTPEIIPLQNNGGVYEPAVVTQEKKPSSSKWNPLSK